MSNLPLNPKPHIEEKGVKSKVTRSFDYDKVLKEMVDLVRENKEFVKKHTNTSNEALFR